MKKYNIKNIIWCPIDLPKCPTIPNLSLHNSWYFWNFTKLTVDNSTPYSITDFTSEVKQKYPSLVDWFKLFPYKSIRNIKLNYQTNKVNQHIDFTKPELNTTLYKNNVKNEPCGYRVLLRGTRKNKLYVINNEKKVYCELPEETDVYVLGHTSTLHGVDDDVDRYTFFTHFEIDATKHNLLLKQSLKKYSDYAIMK